MVALVRSNVHIMAAQTITLSGSLLSPAVNKSSNLLTLAAGHGEVSRP